MLSPYPSYCQCVLEAVVERSEPEPDDRFIGFDYINYGGIFVPVSDVEKTLLDFTYYGISLDRETLSALENVVNRKKLAEYTNRLYSISRKN